MQVAMLNSVETVRMVKQGFHVLARAADEIELPQSGLGMSRRRACSRTVTFYARRCKRCLKPSRIIATQKEKTVPVLMKQLALNQDEAALRLRRDSQRLGGGRQTDARRDEAGIRAGSARHGFERAAEAGTDL